MTGWETFDFAGKTSTPKLTIRKGGQLGLNSAAVKLFKLEEYRNVVLRINQSDSIIGVKPTNEDNEKGARGFKVIQGGATIPAKNFIEYYKLNNVLERRLICEWDDEEHMIVAKYSL